MLKQTLEIAANDPYARMHEDLAAYYRKLNDRLEYPIHAVKAEYHVQKRQERIKQICFAHGLDQQTLEQERTI